MWKIGGGTNSRHLDLIIHKCFIEKQLKMCKLNEKHHIRQQGFYQEEDIGWRPLQTHHKEERAACLLENRTE